MSSKMTGRRWGWWQRQGCVFKDRTWCPPRTGAAPTTLSVLWFLKDQYLGVHDNTADRSSSLQEAAGASSRA